MAYLKNRSSRRAIVTVEAVLVLPVLLLLTFGVMEYGWMFLKMQEVTNATRHGARIAITPDATSAQVKVAITDLLGKTGVKGATVTLTPTDISAVAAGQTITVTTSVPYANVTLLNLTLLPVPTSLQTQVGMAKEGP